MTRCERTGKRRFRDEREAEDVLKWARKHQGAKIPRRTYYCAHCRGWHLTSLEAQTPNGRVVKNKGFKRFLNDD